METILFGITILAAGWLVIWTCFDHSKPSKTWWPFDYRDDSPADAHPSNSAPRWTRSSPKRPWKRSGF